MPELVCGPLLTVQSLLGLGIANLLLGFQWASSILDGCMFMSILSAIFHTIYSSIYFSTNDTLYHHTLYDAEIYIHIYIYRAFAHIYIYTCMTIKLGSFRLLAAKPLAGSARAAVGTPPAPRSKACSGCGPFNSAVAKDLTLSWQI